MTEQFTPFLTMNASLLKEIISQVAFAADEYNPAAKWASYCVQIKIESGKLTFAAADPYRLALRSTNGWLLAEDKTILIPANYLCGIGEMLTGGDVQISISESDKILFALHDVNVELPIIQGSYHDVRKVIPQAYKTRAVVKKDDLIHAIKHIEEYIGKDHILQLEIANERLLIAAYGCDYENDAPAIIHVNVDGSSQTILLDVRYLSQVLDRIECKEIALEINSSLSPVAIKPVSAMEYVYILMPVLVEAVR